MDRPGIVAKHTRENEEVPGFVIMGGPRLGRAEFVKNPHMSLCERHIISDKSYPSQSATLTRGNEPHPRVAPLREDENCTFQWGAEPAAGRPDRMEARAAATNEWDAFLIGRVSPLDLTLRQPGAATPHSWVTAVKNFGIFRVSGFADSTAIHCFASDVM
jgi:hypothetical protein